MAEVEHRAPTGSTLPLRFVGVGQAQHPRWNADKAISEGLYSSSLVYRAIQVKAQALAGLPFRAGPERPDRLGGTAEHNPDSPLAKLLGPPPGGPAPKLPARRLLAWSITQLLTTGRFAWEIETTGPDGTGDIVALWPLVSARLEAIPSTGGNAWWTGYRYGPEGTQKRRLAPSEVFMFWSPSARDFREPESPLEAGALDVSVATLTDRYNYAFLRNDARPAAVVTTPAFASQDELEAWKRQWLATYGGVDNAGRMIFLEVEDDGAGNVTGAVEINNVGLPQKDAQVLETYLQKQSSITMLLGVPLSMLGDASGRTYANAEAEEKAFWRITMPFLIADLEDAINLELAPRLGLDVGWFDASGVEALDTPPKPITSPVGAPELVRSRLMTVDEARAEYGLPALADGSGDRLMTADEIAALSPRGAGEPAGAGAQRAAPALPLHREARVAVDSGDRRERLWRAADASYRNAEAQWTRALRRLFTRQRDASLKRLRGQSRGKAIASGTPTEARVAADGVFDPGFWEAETADELRALYESLTSSAFARLTEQLGVSFDLQAEHVDRFIAERANQLAGYVTDTTYGRITDALAEGVGAGEGVDELAARVEDVFDDATANRAEVIARTEVVSASNGASLEAVANLGPGIVAAAEWIATRDGRTRDSHASIDGQVVPVGQPFTVGGAQLAYPGDPAGPAAQTIQCRCTLAWLTPDEVTP